MRRSSILVLTAVLGAGCASYPLLDEQRTLPYARLLAEAQGLARHTARVETAAPGEPTLRLALEHVPARRAPSQRVLMLVNGLFASRSTWRFLVGPLTEQNDVVLLDAPGCGASDAPDPCAAGPEAYTPRWMAVHIMRALERWLAEHPQTASVVLVGHSLGAMSIVRLLSDPLLADEAPRLLARVTHAVLISPPDVIVERASPTMARLVALTDLEVDLARALGLYDRWVAKGVWEAQYAPHRSALRADAEAMRKTIATEGSRRAGQAMLRRYNPVRPDGSLDREASARRRADLARIAVPVLVMVGAGDEAVPPENGRRLTRSIPRARLLVIPEARHSPQGERAPLVATTILAFLDEVPGRVGGERPLPRLGAAD